MTIGLVAVALVFLAAWPAGCGREPVEVEIVAQEYRFDPDRVRLKADRPWTLVVVNRGREPHEFTSLLFHDPRVTVVHAGPQPPSPGPTLRVEAGGSVRLTLLAPPGTYPFQCRIRGHGAMKGLITLE